MIFGKNEIPSFLDEVNDYLQENLPKTYTITANITNGVSAGAQEIKTGETVYVYLYNNLGYALPTSITVAGAQYIYNNETGIITLKNATSNVSISASCPVRYSINVTITNGSYTMSQTGITEDETATVVLTADSGYRVSRNITVTGADYTYDYSTFTITLSNPTGNINITTDCIVFVPIYGVEWVNDATPDTTMTRTDDATNMTYAISNGKVASDFDNVFPYALMKRVTIQNDYNEDNVFVYVPSMWFRIKEGNTYTGQDYFDITGIAVSSQKGEDVAGYRWVQSKPFYYGAYGASSGLNGLRSIAGVNRAANINSSNFRGMAMSNGTGYHQRDLYSGTVLMFLWFIEFATKYSLSVMTGVVTGHLENTGSTDTFYNETEGDNFCVSGYDTTTGQMVWHGIEDFIGNLREYEDGIYGAGSGGVQYATSDYTKYNDPSQMYQLAFRFPANGCLIALGYDINAPLLVQPIAIINDSQFRFGFRSQVSGNNGAVSIRGSTWNGGSAGGGVASFARYPAASYSTQRGARLCLEYTE